MFKVAVYDNGGNKLIDEGEFDYYDWNWVTGLTLTKWGQNISDKSQDKICQFCAKPSCIQNGESSYYHDLILNLRIEINEE